MKDREKRTEVTQDMVVQGLARVAFAVLHVICVQKSYIRFMRHPACYISCLLLHGLTYLIGVWILFVVCGAALAWIIYLRVKYGYFQTVVEIETGTPPRKCV